MRWIELMLNVMFSELTAEQQKTLIDIRRRKTELLLEIQVGALFLQCYVILFVCSAKLCVSRMLFSDLSGK